MFLLSLILFSLCGRLEASEPNWDRGAPVPVSGRANPYELSPSEFQEFQNKGKIHAQIYPVAVTGLLPPLQPLLNFFQSDDKNLLRLITKFFFGQITGIKSLNNLLAWVGLHKYPKINDEGVYAVPYPNGVRPRTRIGFGTIETEHGTGFSISCAACHSANLFGKTVFGLSNRFPNANETFYYAKKILPLIPPSLFQSETHASDGETYLFQRTQKKLAAIGVKQPAALGLDTSLAQVALSLAHRNLDPYATYNEKFERKPRPERLEKFVADSKPAVWWNLKYKNRWLSDGSVVSGNPIYTNILWNEIGRGTDLQELEGWLEGNNKVIQELTTAVFSIQAPRFTDFFNPELISLEKAKRGEQVFLQRCIGCHGEYKKAWSMPGSEQLPLVDQLKTVEVKYHERTPVIDVGTDRSRREGMKSLEQLNDLSISKKYGVKVESQRGYVPPPLVGIWARWPYLHNNSVPSLCALLTASEKRPKRFFMGPAKTFSDFDRNCNGYPKGKAVPAQWKKNSELIYNTKRQGLSNSGHDEGIFLRDGKELLTNEEKLDLIQFLQTL